MPNEPDPAGGLDDAYAAFAAGGDVARLLQLAADEDTGGRGLHGDATALGVGREARAGAAHVVARQEGVLAGGPAAPDVVRAFDAGVRIERLKPDGAAFRPGDALLTVRGPLHEIVTVERTLLNLIGRLSGVATLTARYVQAAAAGGPAGVYDTRKTTPGLRALEKYAVLCGGGRTHRMGLHDAVLIKDNHIAGAGVDDAGLAGFVREAGARARAARPVRFVEVEVDRLSQLASLLTLPAGVVDVVLLDNMGPDLLREAVGRRDAAGAAVRLEASGGITLDTIGPVARSGVDRISVGALTHSATSVDVGLDFEPGGRPG